MAAVTLLGAATFTTASGAKSVTATPAAGDLIVIVTAHTGNVATAPPADTQGSGSYTLLATAAKNASADTLQVWVRNSTIPAAASTSFTHPPGATTGGGLAVFKVTGMSRVGLGAKRQSASQSNQSSGTPTPVFDVAPLTGNALISAVFNASNTGGVPAKATWTLRLDVGYNAPTTGLDVMAIDSGETGTSIAWGGTSSAFASIVVELDTSPADPLFQDQPWEDADVGEDQFQIDSDSYQHQQTDSPPPALETDWDFSADEPGSVVIPDCYQQSDFVAAASPIQDIEWDWSGDAPATGSIPDSYQQADFTPIAGAAIADAPDFDVEVEDDFFDDFGNEDAQALFDDPWQWHGDGDEEVWPDDERLNSSAAASLPGPFDADGWIRVEEEDDDWLPPDNPAESAPQDTSRFDDTLDWEWGDEASDDWTAAVLSGDAKPPDPALTYANEWNWSAEDLDDDSWWAESTYASVNPDAPLPAQAYADEWGWSAEDLEDDAWWVESTYASVNAAGATGADLGAFLYIVPRMIAGTFTSGGSVQNAGNATAVKSWLPPQSVPIVDGKGFMTTPWYRFFNFLANKKLSGPLAPTITDISNTITGVQVAATETTTVVTGMHGMGVQNAQVLATTVEVSKASSLAGAEQIPPVQLQIEGFG